MNKNVLDFWQKYELIESTKTFIAISNNPKSCRFCNLDEQHTTFNTEAHLIPELMGENKIISYDECDKCNNKFSGFESHLSIFFRPYLTIMGVKGKKKVPTFQSRTEDGNEHTRTIITVNDNKRNVILQNLDDYQISKENKTFTITFRKPPHKPFLVYKSLVKIALSLLPSEKIKDYKNVFDWILDKSNETDAFITAFITVIKAGKFRKPFAELYSAKRIYYKNHFLPEMTCIIGFGNVVVQIFLPLSNTFDYQKAKLKTPNLNLFPSVIYDKNKTVFNFKAIDLIEKNSITYNEILHFSFEDAEINIPR
ncbi:HNH endonuclease [Flavobacterium pectinovorum]|uniref:HNH endonuclease 5 domain-containing protein n=1 Tax=Flavobacterium pectinovorum TaxID=29533 RepID=A0A502F3F0_9FLAO|nr:HNH endonuclease [Flavobacterium pectinovorum]TPG44553.1 hypothetical protein EAH81_03505 [Flavobacterium pectinovorum]